MSQKYNINKSTIVCEGSKNGHKNGIVVAPIDMNVVCTQWKHWL